MTRLRSSIRHALATRFLAGLLAACGGGGDAGASPPPAPAPPPATAQRTVRIQVSSALAGGESFQFSLGSQSATLAAFCTALAEGCRQAGSGLLVHSSGTGRAG